MQIAKDGDEFMSSQFRLQTERVGVTSESPPPSRIPASGISIDPFLNSKMAIGFGDKHK